MRIAARGWPLVTVLGTLVAWSLPGRAASAADDAPIAGGSVPSASAVATHAPSTDAVDWTVSGAVGPVIAVLANTTGVSLAPSFGLKSTAWQVEVQRRSRDESFLLGVTVEGTHDETGGQQMLGADVFAGKPWRFHRWSLEATVGAGLEAGQIREQQLTYSLGFYAQGAIAAAVPISRTLEIFLKLGAHLTPVHDEDWFVASTVGLRWTLP